uniref:uncharacterized protein LOC122601647 n=1 Tax=Erigeron canadensis TaxID=72917 RepID=UPI001CB8FC65|nr:uncharacterized protein LOC122601647 [Erigeron canadensis]
MTAFLEEFQHLKVSLEDILFATANFSDNKIIGTGGFGKVYKGEISHFKGRSMVAFKRLDPRYGQGNPEFWKEIMMLSRYNHENLISLLGFCNEGGEKILLYEHASGGSLDLHLGSVDLKWIQRLKICLEVAKGLEYLQDPKGSQQRVLHRDIKSSNILLDKNMRAKISDLGLSKIGPANQQHSVLVSHAVGTPGYCDPLYMEEGFLTKESDIYSFGVILLEVLCGRLCYVYMNRQCQILVPMWKQSYKKKKLDVIIFQDLLHQMDPACLEIFSELAFRCLKKAREERPLISYVVEKLELALELQEIYEVVKQPKGYEEIIIMAIPPLTYRSIDELKTILSNGIFLNEGKTWFSINKTGEHCEMISTTDCLIPIASDSKNRYISENGSRFLGGCFMAYDGKFKTHVKTQFLSPQITYTVNLVFKFIYTKKAVCKPTYSVLRYKLEAEEKLSVCYLADKREDGWLMAELYQFTSDSRYVDLQILIEGSYSLAVEGIEFRPLDMVRCEVLEDEKVDMPSISDSDTIWEEKLPKNHEEMIKWSKDSLQWTTKKELYFILCKGFPINNGKEWLSLDKKGRKCHMLEARMALLEEECNWESFNQSRFKEVAVHPNKSFHIVCTINPHILSPRTRYASYLVYKLPNDPYEFEAPMVLMDKDHSHSTDAPCLRFVHLLSPQTPVIRRRDDQNAHNPLNRPKIKGLPRQRQDGWMEVQIWEFITCFTTKTISMDLELASSFYKVIEGLIVQGIEFKPIYK